METTWGCKTGLEAGYPDGRCPADRLKGLCLNGLCELYQVLHGYSCFQV